MKSSSAKELVFNKPEVEIVLPKREEIIPPWRKRLRWWLSEWLREPRLIREVGPHSRPLERYEFESRNVYEKHRAL